MTAEVQSSSIASFDGQMLAVHELGMGGRPLFLIHGLFSNAHINWVKFGHAARLAEAGFHCIMPDLRAHGQSAAPHDPAAYPANILLQDARHLIGHYGFAEYDIAGFSLGARTTAHLLVEGLCPRRAILAGMGLRGLSDWSSRRAFFKDVIAHYETAKRGDPHWMAIQFMKTTGIDPVAASLLLDSFANLDTDRLGDIDVPVLVLSGTEDRDNGDPAALADILPHGRLAWVPGDHMGCVAKPDLGVAMAQYLTEGV